MDLVVAEYLAYNPEDNVLPNVATNAEITILESEVKTLKVLIS